HPLRPRPLPSPYTTLFRSDRLAQEAVETSAARVVHVADVRGIRHHRHVPQLLVLTQQIKDFVAIHPRHLKIEEDHIGHCDRPQAVPDVTPGRHADDGRIDVKLLQQVLQDVDARLIVLDDECMDASQRKHRQRYSYALCAVMTGAWHERAPAHLPTIRTTPLSRQGFAQADPGTLAA